MSGSALQRDGEVIHTTNHWRKYSNCQTHKSLHQSSLVHHLHNVSVLSDHHKGVTYTAPILVTEQGLLEPKH